ncbi:retinol dehydrogenase 12-like [Ctenocephalides felis]|uniref:retinol dehydrogenase 12-like n=1 Tax=Ctenocephalides felis TaxID=7515 RepID=UPI000E6E3192|nr:retinol dehydrogenase 12-like [Ctenocephalides felis]
MKFPKPVYYLSAIGTAAGISFCVKDYMSGGTFESDIRADGKVIVVTGANTGIGKETARELAKRGAHVYMACRDMERCEKAREEIVLETKNKYVYCRKCDLSSLNSVREFSKVMHNERKHIDVLINNAGVMRCPLSRTSEGFEMQLGVNHLGHFLLTNLLLDMLKASPSARIVHVSSLAHTRGKINIEDLNSDHSYDPGAAYNQSKLANIMFSNELAKRLEGTNVTSNALHPGVVDTELVRHMPIFTSSVSKHILKFLLWPFVKTPISGAQTSLHVALHPDLEGVNGKYFSDCKEKQVAVQATDSKTASWLWAVSEKWTGLIN